jgi:HlyD family secretion protein
MSGQELTPAEQNALAAMRQMMMRAGGGGGQGGGGFRRNQGEPSSYIVFALRNGKPTPVQIRTGLTDLDYVEVVSGLTEQDTVLVLPSASLVNAQRDMQQRMRNITGGGLPGVQQQTQTQTRPQATRP